MIEVRPFKGLGGADHGWLKAKHHFSFASYYDPKRMGWGALRVWNDDEIAPHTGFPPHPHANMEIITYVRDGAITHADSLGNEGRTEAGDVQVMSAGSGIHHAEYNREPGTTRIFQIWIVPERQGGRPSWGTRPFPKGDRAGRFVALASGLPGDEEALPIRTGARVVGATLRAGLARYDQRRRPAVRRVQDQAALLARVTEMDNPLFQRARDAAARMAARFGGGDRAFRMVQQEDPSGVLAAVRRLTWMAP